MDMIGPKFITKEGEENLKNFKYSGGDNSLIYIYFYSPLAEWCVDNLTPSWLA